MNIPNTLTVNETQYTLVRLLGKGKGGYSYLVTDGAQQYVLKQIHHEPCNYYAFGDKLQAELRDYETLRHLGIPLPELLAVDAPRERLLKTYPRVRRQRSCSKPVGWTPTGSHRCAPCAGFYIRQG